MTDLAKNNPKAPDVSSTEAILRACFDKDLSALRVVNVTGVGFTTTSTSTTTTTSTTTSVT